MPPTANMVAALSAGLGLGEGGSRYRSEILRTASKRFTRQELSDKDLKIIHCFDALLQLIVDFPIYSA